MAGLRRSIRLVPDINDGGFRGKFQVQCRLDLCVSSDVVVHVLPGQVMQKQQRICAFNFSPGALNADFFNLIKRFIGLPQACGIHHMQRHAVDLDQLRHLVARGTRHRRDDGQLGPRQRIEQRTFTRIGLPGYHHLDAFTQDAALLGLVHHADQRGLQPCQLALCIGFLQKVDVFFREIKRGLHQHAQVNQLRQQRVNGI